VPLRNYSLTHCTSPERLCACVCACVCVCVSDLFQSAAEALKDRLDVAAFLHWNDSHLIFLVDPDEKRLLQVVPASSKHSAHLKLCQYYRLHLQIFADRRNSSLKLYQTALLPRLLNVEAWTRTFRGPHSEQNISGSYKQRNVKEKGSESRGPCHHWYRTGTDCKCGAKLAISVIYKMYNLDVVLIVEVGRRPNVVYFLNTLLLFACFLFCSNWRVVQDWPKRAGPEFQFSFGSGRVNGSVRRLRDWPDAASVRPITHGAGVDHQVTSRLLKQEVILHTSRHTRRRTCRRTRRPTYSHRDTSARVSV